MNKHLKFIVLITWCFYFTSNDNVIAQEYVHNDCTKDLIKCLNSSDSYHVNIMSMDDNYIQSHPVRPFGYLTDTEITKGVVSNCDHFAIHCKWHDINRQAMHKTILSKKYCLNRASELSGFLSGRLRCRIPDWVNTILNSASPIWKNVELRLQDESAVPLASAIEFRCNPYSNNLIAKRNPQFSDDLGRSSNISSWSALSENSESETRELLIELKDGLEVRCMTRLLFPADTVDNMNGLHLHVSDCGDNYISAAIDAFAGSFTINCHRWKDDSVVWRAVSWGTGEIQVNFGGAIGPSFIEFVKSSDKIILFGYSFGSIFIERYDLNTGVCDFRFCPEVVIPAIE